MAKASEVRWARMDGEGEVRECTAQRLRQMIKQDLQMWENVERRRKKGWKPSGQKAY